LYFRRQLQHMLNTRVTGRTQAPRPRRAQPERQIHAAIIQHLRLRAKPDVVFWHTPNGAHYGRTKKAVIHGAVMKSLGVRAGVSDIVLLHESKFFALELKAPGGRSTEAQIKFRADVNAAGGYASEAVGLDAALACLQCWNLLRGVAS
jgi:hypothetical protein